MMSSAACLSLQVGRSLKTIIGIRLEARRCDCSFVVAVPVQTSVGKLQSRRCGAVRVEALDHTAVPLTIGL
jgi:hypothetical protein